ncbi:MAG TPA: CopG family transcriptional regulator [Dehalococcoidia bacterium]
MARMVRKQVYLTPEQDRRLKRRARELGISESDLIRRSIEEAGGEPVPSHDEQAWRDELAFLRERARLQDLKRIRGWTREELYEDRLERFSR